MEFRSDSFQPVEAKGELVDRGRSGSRLAKFLAECLAADGFVVGTGLEDWGWVVHIENPGFPLWVGCGNYEEHSSGYLVFIEPSKPFVRRWLKKYDTRQAVESVALSIHKGLESHPDVHELRWWTEAEANYGKAETGQ